MPTQDDPIRLLLVDDEADFRRPLVKRLTRRGLKIIEAGNGLEALAVLENSPADVVVMDVNMPEMNGLAALARIKEKFPHIEVILLTGQASAVDGVEGMKEGAFDYLSKPIEFEHLLGKIGQAHEKILRLKEQVREADFRAKMESRMNAAERLAALGTLAAGVAHEINNPLAIISESAGWLKSRAAKEPDLPEKWVQSLDLALGKIQTSVERARRITHQLLSFARKTDSSVSEFDLMAVASEVVDLTRKTADHSGAEVVLENDTGALTIWSDPYQVRQVLINLVSNALQAVGSDGLVRIRLTGNGDEVAITVSDNGPGIPKENLTRIFEPFFSTKPPGKGTGLGLSVSLSIIEKLGGRMDVESKLGQGATFKIVLPVKPLLPRGE